MSPSYQHKPADRSGGHEVEAEAAEPEEPFTVVPEGAGSPDDAHEQESCAHAELEKSET